MIVPDTALFSQRKHIDESLLKRRRRRHKAVNSPLSIELNRKRWKFFYGHVTRRARVTPPECVRVRVRVRVSIRPLAFRQDSSSCRICAIMDDFDFGFPYEQDALNFTTPDISNLNFPGCSQKSSLEVEQEQVEQEPGETDQSATTRSQPRLLRSGDLEPDRAYDRNNPTCIHYDLMLTVFNRGIGKLKSVKVHTISKKDLVLASSDVWKEQLKDHIAALLNDPKKFSAGSSYISRGTVAIRAKHSQRGLDDVFEDEGIPWAKIDEHLESLWSLFKQRRMLITVTIQLTYQETEATTATQTTQGNSATKRQRALLDAESIFMTRVYTYHEYRGGSCRQNSMHCLVDDKGNHHAIDSETMRTIYNEIKKNMKEGEKFEDVQNIEIPADIRNKILRMSKKRKANGDAGCRSCKSNVSPGGSHTEPLFISGDPTEKMRDYCTWNLMDVQSDRHRGGMEAANQFAMEELLDLNSIHQHPNAVKDAMVAKGVPLGSALRFVSNIPRFIESRESENE